MGSPLSDLFTGTMPAESTQCGSEDKTKTKYSCSFVKVSCGTYIYSSKYIADPDKEADPR